VGPWVSQESERVEGEGERRGGGWARGRVKEKKGRWVGP
jgi:hypothetical protein